jgi:hypothetical protein
MIRIYQQARSFCLAASVTLFVISTSTPVPSMASENRQIALPETTVKLSASTTTVVAGHLITLTAKLNHPSAYGPGLLLVETEKGGYLGDQKVNFAAGACKGTGKITKPGTYIFSLYYYGVRGKWADGTSNPVKVTVLK